LLNQRVAVIRIKKKKPLGFVYIPYVKGVSEEFKHIGNQYNVRMIFKTKHILRSSLMKTRPERECFSNIPCECGGSYIGETDGPLVMRLHEHRHDLKEGFL
jgi:hypothetical protein